MYIKHFQINLILNPIFFKIISNKKSNYFISQPKDFMYKFYQINLEILYFYIDLFSHVITFNPLLFYFIYLFFVVFFFFGFTLFFFCHPSLYFLIRLKYFSVKLPQSNNVWIIKDVNSSNFSHHIIYLLLELMGHQFLHYR